MNKTPIEWTTFSANPIKYRRKSDGKIVWACVKTSPGCAHCYSEAIAVRFNRGNLFNAANMKGVEPFLDEAECRKMLTAKTIGGVPVSGARCFIGDMTDIFGEWVPDALLNELFSGVLELRTDVTWQILTKRAARMSDYLRWRWGDGRIPCRHIHFGVSVEDQRQAEERIPHLVAAPAVVRFLSCEPLLGPIDLRKWLTPEVHHHPDNDLSNPDVVSALSACARAIAKEHGMGLLDWVIIGGESGHGARLCSVEWIRSIRDQCKAASVPVFIKQLGSNAWMEPGELERRRADPGCIPLQDPKGGDMSEWPAGLSIREFPQ